MGKEGEGEGERDNAAASPKNEKIGERERERERGFLPSFLPLLGVLQMQAGLLPPLCGIMPSLLGRHWETGWSCLQMHAAHKEKVGGTKEKCPFSSLYFQHVLLATKYRQLLLRKKK